ncbi:DNA-binding protein HU-beta [Consotaella salsifontis]|uniref:DNA-binding protein HU-beta n=2 Tax=Consotaella salsifontis TaxID=1365950 RepID=A0A1T4TEX2_9HYPH|nr:DNA-binding protein HU-beta [Consotaella salsifontis]
MNKSELVAAVAEKTSLPQKDVVIAVGAIFDVVTETLAKGEDLRLVGFGTFGVSQRAASMGRNPSTGATAAIPARTV